MNQVFKSQIFLLVIGLSSIFGSLGGQTTNRDIINENRRILFILDVSSSMLKDWNGNRRWDEATKIISLLVDSIHKKDPYLQFSLRVLGSKHPSNEHNCYDTKSLVPFNPDNQNLIKHSLGFLFPYGWSPINLALKTAAYDDLTEYNKYQYGIILITDGEESCGGDICETVENYLQEKFFFQPYIIGLDPKKDLSSYYSCIGEYLALNSESDEQKIIDKVLDFKTYTVPSTGRTASFPAVFSVSEELLENLKKDSLNHAIALENQEKNRLAEEAEKLRLENIKLEQAREAREIADKERIAKAEAEKRRLENERIAQEKEEQDRLAQEAADKEQERLNQERILNEKKEQEDAERKEQERLAKEEVEKKRLENERIQKEKAEQDRLAKEAAEKEQERINKERIQKEKKEQEEAERKEQERLAKEEAEKKRLENERIQKEKAEKDRLAKERQAQQREAERIAKEQKLAKAEKERQILEKQKAEDEEERRRKTIAEEKAKRSAEERQASISTNSVVPNITGEKEIAGINISVVEESSESKLLIYLRGPKGELYNSSPIVKLYQSNPNTPDVSAFRSVDFRGNPKPIIVEKPGNYSVVVGNSKSYIARNILIPENKTVKLVIDVGPGAIRFAYGNDQSKPLVGYTAQIQKIFPDKLPTESKKTDEKLIYPPGNYHVTINTIPETHLNVDVFEGSTSLVLSIKETGKLILPSSLPSDIILKQTYNSSYKPFLRIKKSESDSTYDILPGSYLATYYINGIEKNKKFIIRSNKDLELTFE